MPLGDRHRNRKTVAGSDVPLIDVRSPVRSHISPDLRTGYRPSLGTATAQAFRPAANRHSWLCCDGTGRSRLAADWLDAMLENCILYISPMYEFSHGLGQNSNPSSALAHQLPPATD